MKQIGIIGAGKVGIVLAQLALAAGYTVDIAGSGKADKISLTIDILAPGAHAMTTTEVIMANDVLILALPLSKFEQIPSELMADKLILDAMNYWWEVDGNRPEFNNPRVSTSELVQAYFTQSIVVKAFNHMGYHDLADESALNNFNQERKAIALAGNHVKARAKVATIVEELGFEPIILESLAEGIKLQPGLPTFGANLSAEKLNDALAMYSSTPFGQQVAKEHAWN